MFYDSSHSPIRCLIMMMAWLTCFIAAADKVLQLYIYKRDGNREETFPRREWARVKYPHTVRVDAAGRIWAAGLQVRFALYPIDSVICRNAAMTCRVEKQLPPCLIRSSVY